MKSSVSVLCVLCVSVVKIRHPLPYFIPHPSSFIPLHVGKCGGFQLPVRSWTHRDRVLLSHEGMHYNNGLRQPQREKNRLDWPASMASFSLYNNKGRILPPCQPDIDEQRIEQRQSIVHR